MVVLSLGESGHHNPIGQAVVNLWVMIEDKCNFNRKEVDIFMVDSTDSIGSVLVDVRGYHLLERCS